MIDGWEPPGIEAVEAWESRRLASIPVPGLAGNLHHDLGRGSLAVRLIGSLIGDDGRDAFLKNLREKFHAGEPVDFVADIVAESHLEKVLIVHFELSERAGDPDGFRYDIVLREYVEPPEPPALGFGLNGLDLDLGLDIDLGLDLLDLPGLLGALPEIGPLLEPVKVAADKLGAALGEGDKILKPLSTLLGE